MINLTRLTPHTAADTSLSYKSRSANVGVVSLDKYSIIIDSGNSLNLGKALRVQAELEFSIPIKYLFLTHTHTDHRKGLDAFRDFTIIASQKTIRNMPQSVKIKKFDLQSFNEEFLLKENDHLIIFNLIGGHTIGSSIAYFPSEKVLFGGDLFFSGGVNFNLPFLNFYQNAVYEPIVGKKTGNPDEYINALEQIKKRDIQILIPGHGEVIKNPQEEISNLVSFFKDLRDFFINKIRQNKRINEIELPHLELIESAYTLIKQKQPNIQVKDKQWLSHYLDSLKICFYNYYSELKSP